MSVFRRFVGTVQVGGLYVLLALLPFSKAAVEISFGVLFLTWLFQRCDPATRADTVWLTPRFRPLVYAILAYLAACALSIPVSKTPILSLNGFINKWVEYLLFFVVAADLGRRPGVVRNGLMIIAASSLFVLIEAVTQEHAGRGIFSGHLYQNYQRATGPYENPIDLATYLMVVIPLMLMAAIGRRRWLVRTMLWSLLVALVVLLARTDALGAWLGLCLGLPLVIVVEQPMVRRYGLIALVGIVLFCSIVPQGVGQNGIPHSKEAFSFARLGTSDRWNMWQAALGMIRDRPILGHGVNTFMANYLDYWVGGERQPRYAHNCYLQVAAETGFVGLVTFLGLLGLIFAQWFAALRRGGGSDDRLALIGFTAGLFAFVLQAGIDTNFYSLRQAALFWLLAGLATGLSDSVGGQTPLKST